MKNTDAFVDALEDLYSSALESSHEVEVSFWMFVEWYEGEYGESLPLPGRRLVEFDGDEFDDLRVWFDTKGK